METILYVLTLLVSIDHSTYIVENTEQLVGSGMLSEVGNGSLGDFQYETGLRLVRQI